MWKGVHCMNSHEENLTLPPKTCSIERLVTVEKDVEKVLAGKKQQQDEMADMQM